MGRRRAHHTHEVGDAYAEGWAEREAWDGQDPKPANPYRIIVDNVNRAKQSEARRESQQRSIALWDQGWADWEEDFERDDLEPVTDFDFRRLLR